MIVQATPVLPESTLAPNVVAEKFQVASLAGLGAQVCSYDEMGNQSCYEDSSLSQPVDDLSIAYEELYGSGAPTFAPPISQLAAQAAPWYASATGDIVIPSQGGYYEIDNQGNSTFVNSTPPPRTSSNSQPNSMQSATMNNTAAIANAVTQSTRLLQMLAIQPGTVVTPTGISRQATGFPISTAGVGISGSLSSSLTGMLPILLIGGILLMAVKK